MKHQEQLYDTFEIKHGLCFIVGSLDQHIGLSSLKQIVFHKTRIKRSLLNLKKRILYMILGWKMF